LPVVSLKYPSTRLDGSDIFKKGEYRYYKRIFFRE